MVDVLKIMKKEIDSPLYYSIQRVMRENAKYYNLVSERNDGKSYQVKHYCVLDALLNGRKFLYMRRYSIEMKTIMVNSYFDDLNLNLLSRYYGKKIHHIECGGSSIDVFIEVEGEVLKDINIGRYHNLAASSHITSNVFKNYANLIYEEYITNKGYLFNEPTELQHVVSTMLRSENGKIFLMGNIKYRNNPYMRDWGIKDWYKLNEGDIVTYIVDDAKIAIERCVNTAKLRNTSMFFGKARQNIVDGGFISVDMPHIPFPFAECKIEYNVKLEHENMTYILSLLTHQEDNITFVYVYPLEEKMHCEREVRLDYDGNPMHTSKLIPITKGDYIMLEYLNMNKVFFSDNLTGTEFNAIRKNYNM